MDLGLGGRRALVLGASQGLGAAVVRSLLAEGAQVIAAARRPEKLRELETSVSDSERARLVLAPVDLARRDSVDALACLALDGGALDILVNNGGGPPPGTAASISAEALSAQFPPMVAHIISLTQAVLPPMLERGWGRIVTIASSGVVQPIANLALSNTLRAALLAWSKTLAAEVAAQGVTVNVVVPGRIRTPRVEELDRAAARSRGTTPEEIERQSLAAIPAGRYGRPEEFAAAVTFLVSAPASYVTGAVLRVDGGMIRAIGS